MVRLAYSAMMSIDGYFADETGNFDWAAPDGEVHAYINELERRFGTHLYGRRMYEVMSFWENETALETAPAYIREYGSLWRAANKIVFSRSLMAASTARTHLRSAFDPHELQKLKAREQRDITIAGPTLAAHACKAGLVDECHFFVAPACVGGGTPALPRDLRLRLELMAHRSFRNGMVYLHYRAKPLE